MLMLIRDVGRMSARLDNEIKEGGAPKEGSTRKRKKKEDGGKRETRYEIVELIPL